MPQNETTMEEMKNKGIDPEKSKKNEEIDLERRKKNEFEGEEIVNGFKNDPKFRKEFISGTNPKKRNIARLRSKMIYDFRVNYNVIISVEEFNSIVFLALWSNGTYETLNSYKKQSSFFVWLKKVAKNAILERLEEEHEISGSRTRSVGNTRLKLLSQSPEKCEMVIDDLMTGSKHHKLLTLLYVERLPEEDIIKQMDIKAEDWPNTKKEAEDKLKDALLRSSYGYEEDILHDKTRKVVTVSSDFVADLAEWCRSKTDANPLADVFGTDLSDEEVHEKVVAFLYDFSEKLKWSDSDRDIWRKRFIHNTPAVEVAREVGRTRGWLDTRYSRLNKKFCKAIRKWWKSHAA